MFCIATKPFCIATSLLVMLATSNELLSTQSYVVDLAASSKQTYKYTKGPVSIEISVVNQLPKSNPHSRYSQSSDVRSNPTAPPPTPIPSDDKQLAYKTFSINISSDWFVPADPKPDPDKTAIDVAVRSKFDELKTVATEKLVASWPAEFAVKISDLKRTYPKQIQYIDDVQSDILQKYKAETTYIIRDVVESGSSYIFKIDRSETSPVFSESWSIEVTVESRWKWITTYGVSQQYLISRKQQSAYTKSIKIAGANGAAGHDSLYVKSDETAWGQPMLTVNFHLTPSAGTDDNWSLGFMGMLGAGGISGITSFNVGVGASVMLKEFVSLDFGVNYLTGVRRVLQQYVDTPTVLESLSSDQLLEGKPAFGAFAGISFALGTNPFAPKK